MRFTEFLSEAKSKKFWQSHNVICFRSQVDSNSCDVLFFRKLFDLLREIDVLDATFLRVSERLQLWKTLQQSFLGETSFYWLGNVCETLKKSKKSEPEIVELLSLYRGPHSIAFVASSKQKISSSAMKRMLVVDVPATFSDRDALSVLSFFNQSLSPVAKKTSPSAEKWSPAAKKASPPAKKASPRAKLSAVKDILRDVSLDNICMLSDYLEVTHVRFMDEFKRNIVAIIDPELSLSSLSHFFFSRQKKKFFNLWASCCNDYTVPFWTVYWSEQLWRAYNVVKFLKHKNIPAARRFAYRLPPEFIKSDWKKCSLPEIVKANQMIYDIDFAFKTGSMFHSPTGGIIPLDFFYSSYFLGSK